jgi:hypothetical protein
MNLEYLLLPVGVAILVVPTAVICGPRMRTRLDQPARRHNEGLLSLVRCRANWIDLVRGFAGAWLVQKPFQDLVSSQDELASTFIGVQLAVLLAGVLAQTLWIRRPMRIIGPVFFLTGMTLALSGTLTGVFALLLGISCALMIGRLSMVFSIVPAALIGFGILFQDIGVMTAFNAAAYALPAFLAFSFGTRISFVRRTASVRGKKKRAPVPTVEPEVRLDADAVIRPNFARPVDPEPVRTPPPARKVVGDSAPLPDFLRIAEEQEPAQRKPRNRLFPRRST